MSKSNGAVMSPRKVQREKGKGLAKEFSGGPIHGEIITWQVKRGSTRNHQDVINALKKAGLDETIAKKIMPRFAFTRACNKLKDEAVFDVVKDTADSVRFQLTKKVLQNEEVKYSKETELTLNKVNGDITCKKKDIEAKAQKLLNEALEIRTTSDVTQMVQTLFERNGDLFSIRDQGGVYFVPFEFLDFAEKVEKFINQLDGDMHRFPVPKGTENGDRSIMNSVDDAFRRLIEDHEKAIDAFTINTRADTMDSLAKRISATRVKIEAYANYLQDKLNPLLKVVDDSKKKLDKRINQLAEEKENAPESPDEIFGHSVTGVIRYMGKEDYSYDEAQAILLAKGVSVSKSTIRGQLWIGRSGRSEFGVPAELDAKQAKQLESERKKVKV